jgi:hypothetical protein
VRPSSHVSWFVEKRGVTLNTRDGTVCRSVPYPHAALWALIADGNYSPTYAVELMSVLMSVDREKAKREVDETITAWMGEGLVCEA